MMLTAFVVYVGAQKSIAQTEDESFKATLAAGRMRHTTESLTNLLSNYLTTGNTEYKKWYTELDDVRQGKTEPPNPYIWDLRVYGERSLSNTATPNASLQTYWELIAKDDAHGYLLRAAWEHLPAVSAIEQQAIQLYESTGANAAENKKKAHAILLEDSYNQAKLNVLRPLMTFRNITSARSAAAIARANKWSSFTRTSFMVFGVLCLILAWRTYKSVRNLHGAPIRKLQEQIERLGKGDFATTVQATDTSSMDPNSLMAWLNLSRTRLQKFDIARQNAENELSERNRALAINNLVLQDLTGGLPLNKLLDKLIIAIEANHPAMLCSVLLVDRDGTSLRHAAAPSLGESWAFATKNVRIGAGVGSCGTAACRKERVLVEDILVHPFWDNFKTAAIEAGIRSAWSQPIMDSQHNILGTFAIYQRLPALPTDQELDWMESFAKLAGYVIERSRLTKTLDETRYMYDLIAKNVHDLIWVLDLPSMRLRYLSPSTQQLLGWAPEDFYARQTSIFSSSLQAELTERFMTMYNQVKAGDSTGMQTTFEYDFTHRDGTPVPMELSAKVNVDEHGNPTTLIGVSREISERRKAEATILKMAFYDALTGLPNRRLLEDRLHQVLALAKRSRTKVAVLFIDLDRFKAVNDEHGHKMGDWLLTQVALRMTTSLRESDTASRVGGDEFVVLLPDCSTVASATIVAHKIRVQMEMPFQHESGVVLNISCCVGIAMYPDQATNARDLLHNGDEAMYQAKKEGRNGVVAFGTPSSTSVL